MTFSAVHHSHSILAVFTNFRLMSLPSTLLASADDLHFAAAQQLPGYLKSYVSTLSDDFGFHDNGVTDLCFPKALQFSHGYSNLCDHESRLRHPSSGLFYSYYMGGRVTWMELYDKVHIHSE